MSGSMVTSPVVQLILGLWMVSQGCPRMIFSFSNLVAKKSCSILFPSIRSVRRILYLIKPPELLVPSTFLASVGRQSFCSGHFISRANLRSTQQIIAPLSISAIISAVSPPSVGRAVIGMKIPLLEISGVALEGVSKEVSPFDSLVSS